MTVYRLPLDGENILKEKAFCVTYMKVMLSFYITYNKMRKDPGSSITLG